MIPYEIQLAKLKDSTLPTTLIPDSIRYP